MSTKKLAIFSIVFLVLLAGGAFSISLILENFDTLSVEGIQFEKTAGYVRLDGLAAPVPRKKRFDYYLYVDLKLEVTDDGNVKHVQTLNPILRDAAMRELHRSSLLRTDGVLGVDLRAMKKRLLKSMNDALGEQLLSKVLIIQAREDRKLIPRWVQNLARAGIPTGHIALPRIVRANRAVRLNFSLGSNPAFRDSL